MRKTNILRFLCLALAGLTMLASCKKDDVEVKHDSGLYLGIIGFNSEQTQYKISLLNKGTAAGFESFIDGLTMDDGTNLFHAVNTGMDKLEAFGTPKDLIHVSIVTFTDGLDLTSYKRNPDFAAKGNSAYLKSVHNRVLTENIGDVNLSSYVIGLRGSDIRDEETHKRFVSNLEDLSSDAENNVFEVSDMSEATESFAEIAKKLYSQSVTVNAILRIPADIGESLCITFDNASSVETSECYLKGVYYREERNGKFVGKLTNVSYRGVKSKSGSTVYAIGEEGDFDLFQFDNLALPDGNPVTIGKNVDHWRKQASAASWVHNSEFNSEEDATKHEEFQSALIMLVLDCSTSLSSDFPKLQSAAKRFIETLVGSYQNPGQSTGGPTDPYYPTDPENPDTPDNPTVPDNPVSPDDPTYVGFVNQTITVNGVSFDMIAVEGGTFTMGATSEQGSDYESDERPTHSVTLGDYYIGKFEVTQALWKAVMGSNPSYFSGDNLPVEQVSWNDIQSFITKLNQLTGKTFALPTEAQWEYAARGGNKSKGYKYSGSNSIGDVAWYTSNSSSKTHAVGTKAPNELGIYDMSGNVWEWCSDWYGSYSSSAQTNPTGAASGSGRVIRGGSWNSNASGCRVSYRGYGTPSSRGSNVGFRVVLLP